MREEYIFITQTLYHLGMHQYISRGKLFAENRVIGVLLIEKKSANNGLRKMHAIFAVIFIGNMTEKPHQKHNTGAFLMHFFCVFNAF